MLTATITEVMGEILLAIPEPITMKQTVMINTMTMVIGTNSKPILCSGQNLAGVEHTG